MNEYICYGIIDLDTNEFLKTSYKLYVPFYRTREKAKNGLRGYKAQYKTNKAEYIKHIKKAGLNVLICIVH